MPKGPLSRLQLLTWPLKVAQGKSNAECYVEKRGWCWLAVCRDLCCDEEGCAARIGCFGPGVACRHHRYRLFLQWWTAFVGYSAPQGWFDALIVRDGRTDGELPRISESTRRRETEHETLRGR